MDDVLVEYDSEHGGAIATITVNRPEKLNALDESVLRGIGVAADGIGPDVACVILTGAGDKAFVAGADIEAMQGFDAARGRAFSELGHASFAKLEALPCPVIAAVNGFALGGGCELALACDFIHASTKARFGQPEVKLGVIPGFGGTQRLSRRVGIGVARELLYTGRMIKADEALRIGLVNGVHPPEELLANVRAIAAEIITMGPLAVARAKAVVRDGEGLALPEANRLEAEAFGACFATHDQKEGMRAFLEKRPARFERR